jgi:signal transduction histidine kinase
LKTRPAKRSSAAPGDDAAALRARLTATAEILKVIAASPRDVQPVFEAIVRSAVRLCGGLFGAVYRFDGETLHFVAQHNYPRAALQLVEATYPRPPDRSHGAGRAILTKSVVRIEDVFQDGEYRRAYAEGGGWRRVLAVPMMRSGVPLGTISVAWVEPGAIPDAQVELLKTFADQAAIAIENTRLFNETQEALKQQTAISEILQVISSSPTDVGPVLSAVAERAARLCEAEFVTVFMAEERVLRAAGYSSAAASHPFADGNDMVPLDRSYIAGRAAVTRQTVHLEDVVPLLESEYPGARENQKKFGFRTLLAVPLLRNNKAIGVIAASRRVARRFSDKQVALVETFADQAAIAIENVRLFNETAEALEQQKASGEVLAAIGASLADAAPVFEKILESCQRLFQGYLVGLTMVGEDGQVHMRAYQGPNKAEMEKIYPLPLSRDSGTGCAILDRRVTHYPDVQAAGVPDGVRAGAGVLGFRSIIFAPLIAEAAGIGALWVGRLAAGPFGEKQISLLKTFADQAVIAIQNARLFREINEKSRQLEVANRHKSEFLANMSHELRTPLNAIIGFTRIVMRRSKEALEAKQYENLEKIHSSGQHLLQLINAILDLSKVEAGRVEVNAADVALEPVLEQCAKTVEPLLKAPAVRLVRDFDGALPQVHQDEEKLRQIVINLLSNAVKFTERGTVRLEARGNGASFSITVADTGIGIPPDKLEHVFEEFAQADATSTRVYGGTGLGLTIARRLARLMGGDIGVQSAQGAGSSFTLTLPVRYPG